MIVIISVDVNILDTDYSLKKSFLYLARIITSTNIANSINPWIDSKIYL